MKCEVEGENGDHYGQINYVFYVFLSLDSDGSSFKSFGVSNNKLWQF